MRVCAANMEEGFFGKVGQVSCPIIRLDDRSLQYSRGINPRGPQASAREMSNEAIKDLLPGSMDDCRVSVAIPNKQLAGWIQPLQEKHTFSHAAGDTDTPFLIFIRDAKGVPAYKLECHNGNYDDKSGYNFSGVFQCALFAVKGNTQATGNLLAARTKDEESTDWWNRGRLLSSQLRGECLYYPEYSTVRHFKLRGMLITFRFADIVWSATARDSAKQSIFVEKCTFVFDVIRDETARGPFAEEAVGAKPPTSCYP